MEGLPDILSDRRRKRNADQEVLVAQLYQQIGQLKVELDWLKKSLDLPLESKRALIEPEHADLAVVRQCELLGLARSSLYYRPREVTGRELELMRIIDEQYTLTPFYGIRRMTACLHRRDSRSTASGFSG
jgi:putative transposase